MANFSDNDESFEIHELLDHRGRGKSIEYLVRWRGFGEEEDSWEPAANLKWAEEVLEQYNAKLESKNPRRRSRARDGSGDSVAKPEKTPAKTKKGTVTKTIVKTKTITKTESKNTQASMSESSSPEASPTVTRRSLRTRKTMETEELVKPVEENDTKTVVPEPEKESRLSCVKSALTAPCRMCPSFKMTTKDIPIMVLVTCLLVIASTFYIAGK